MRPLRTARLAAIAALAALAVAGCSDGAGTTSATATAPPPATVPAGGAATVYFLDDAGRLVAERRSVPGRLDARAALEALAQGPRRAGLAPALPRGASLLGVEVAGGTATADFSAPFVTGYPSGGAAAELAVLAPIVYTATGVSGVRAVRITVGGRTPRPVGSQIDLSRPLSRADLPVTVVRPG